MQYASIEPFGFPLADTMTARGMWASVKAMAGKEWQGTPADFLFERPPERVIEVDPVEFLKRALPPPAEPPPPEEPVHPSGES
ncbi:MAG: hypothetical protein AAB721_02785 [Patescibacteria group bacterium]